MSESEVRPLGEGRPTKRRAGADAGGLQVAESRPSFVENADGDADGAVGGRVQGSRCDACGFPSAQTELPWCPVCHRGQMVTTTFEPTGAVWSSTVAHLRVLHRKAPFGVAYLDLDDGPRVLVRPAEPVAYDPGTRLRITHADHGDLVAEPEQEGRG